MQTTENTLTPEQKMELAIARAKENRKRIRDEAKAELANNSKYVDYLAYVQDEEEQIESLQAVMDKLNSMKAIQAELTELSVPLATVKSTLVKPDTASLKVMVTSEVSPACSAVSATTMLAVGRAVSIA